MTGEKKINISGIAVREGISKNGRKYTAIELNKFAPTMIGRPILKDHYGATDNIIGKITHAESIDGGKLVRYEGWVKEDGTNIIDKILDGRVSEVSIGAFSKRVVKDKEDENVLIPIDMEAMELSTTPVPGVTGTSLLADNNKIRKEDFTKIIKDYTEEIKKLEGERINNEQNKCSIKDKKEDIMEEDKTQNVSAVVENVEFTKMKEEFAAMKEKTEALEKANLALEEARRQDAISTYTEKAKAKNLPLKDLSKASMETIQAMTEMVNEITVPTKEAAVEEKVQAKAKSVDVNVSTSTEDFKGYVISTEDVSGRGVAFFKLN